MASTKTKARAGTERRRLVLESIARGIAQDGYPPTIREIAVVVGLKSSNTVAGHISRLQAQGLIERHPHRPRGITLTPLGRVELELGDPGFAAAHSLPRYVPVNVEFWAAVRAEL